MPEKTTSSTLFKPTLVNEIFNKVKGHSTLARLSSSEPIPFAGSDIMVFSMDGEAEIVGEGQNASPNSAEAKTVTVKPIKMMYQHRVTEEFIHMSEEQRLPYLKAFADGFAKKLARGLDIAAFHGVNPLTNTASAIVGNNCFDKAVTNTTPYDSDTPDDCIDAATKLIQAGDGMITGIAMSPVLGSDLGAMKTKGENVAVYPDFRFGASPDKFGGMLCNLNSTVSFKGSKDRAVVGDFENAFKWGFCDSIPLEIIEFGDPDGKGDLKRTGEICLRSKAFVGWGILDKDSFALVTETE